MIANKANIRNEKVLDPTTLVDSVSYGETVVGKIDTTDWWCQILSINPFEQRYIKAELIVRSDDFDLLNRVLDNNGRNEIGTAWRCFRAIIDYYSFHEKGIFWIVQSSSLASLEEDALSKKEIDTKYPDFLFVSVDTVTNKQKLVHYKFDVKAKPIFISEQNNYSTSDR